MRLINLTPHSVTIIRDGESLVIESQGIARCSENEEHLETINIDGINIPIVKKTYGDITGLLEPSNGTIYIVSLLVAKAASDIGRSDVVCPANPVRNEQGQIVGCTSLARP